MSEMTTNAPSDDTLIRDSQLSGFSAFKERLGFCCCRLFKKTSTYDLSSASKDINDEQEKASYINQAYQVEKQARKDKLEKIARTLPGGTQRIRTPISITQTPTRSGINLTQTRPPTNTSTSKTTLNKPSSLAKNKKNEDETSTDDSSEEESSSEDDKSSDSDNANNKRAPVKNANNRR